MNKKFIPRNKMSKKDKRELDNARRTTWNGLKPYSRTFNDGKHYTKAERARNKAVLREII